MELSEFKELGLAGVTIAGMATVLILITKALLAEIKKAREDYSAFVTSNNHNSTEIMKENVATMVEVKNAMENHNRALEKLIDKLN